MSRSPYTIFYDKMRMIVTENKDEFNLPVLSRGDCAEILGFICQEFSLNKDHMINEWSNKHAQEN